MMALGTVCLTFDFDAVAVPRLLVVSLERWLEELSSQMGVAFDRLEAVEERFLKGRSYGEYSPRRGRSP